ncbi:MAG: ribose 1,5-bisphosphokinase PhnN [Pseudorhodobacter sp.]
MLAERLALRGRESRDDIKARLARASYDLPAGIAVIDVQNIGTPAEGIQRLLQAIRA